MGRVKHFTTLVLGEDGIIRDLGKGEYLPKDMMALNAWTQEINPETREYIGKLTWSANYED